MTAGSVIPAVMLSGINSDLPGTIVAQTRQTVYATNEPDAVVIPQGSRLIGRYSADVAYGQSRVLAAWDELILPNGSRISLRGMSAADGQGQSGIEDQVNNHFWKTWSSALLVSFLGVAAQQSQPQNQGAFNTPSGSAQASAAAMNSLSDVSSKILQKKLEHFTHAASSSWHGFQRHGQPLDHLADLPMIMARHCDSNTASFGRCRSAHNTPRQTD